MQRLLEFVQCYHITIRLAYYPPYHSKYNPIERCWGILEQHWNGSLLDSLDVVIKSARTMTWKGKHPVVKLVTTTSSNRRETDEGSNGYRGNPTSAITSLEKWFVDIRCSLPVVRDD